MSKENKALPLDYHAKKKAWAVTEIFTRHPKLLDNLQIKAKTKNFAIH